MNNKSPHLHPIAIAIHGGAGNLKKMNLTPEQEKAYKDTLAIALQTGYDIMNKGGTSVDAVEATIRVLEDCELFNAGKGSVFTHDGKNEMDAAIMNGANLKAGAIANVRTIKNPISGARKIMEHSKFVFLSGRGAEQFAKENGLEIVDTSYFFTQYRWDQLMKTIESDTMKLDHDNSSTSFAAPNGEDESDEKFGTVGCVALDSYGNLAAGTSTGGLVNKMYDRIGDSPLIGSGTYANNNSCAVSCTGKGEDFIRLVVAYDISALMQYQNMSLQQAADSVIYSKLKKEGGHGGCIAVDSKGNIAMPFTTSGMFRGLIDTAGEMKVMLYEGE